MDRAGKANESKGQSGTDKNLLKYGVPHGNHTRSGARASPEASQNWSGPTRSI
jgi:hypothetical protein